MPRMEFGVAVILDGIDDNGQAVCRSWGFRPLPGCNNRLVLSWGQIDEMVSAR